MHAACNFCCCYKKDGDRLIDRVCCDETRGNGCKLKEGIFQWNIRKVFFIIRAARHWHRLLPEVMDVPFLEITKVRLDRALST